ncbi:hypothetical protein JHK82_055406 [Glycine max]|nr:hypothetical protein JHK85_056230 [Glycine max]KAG5076711.1 hypothetical protein JHK82_055406 [Glycine max]
MWCVPQCMKAGMATSSGNTNTKSQNVNVKAVVTIEQSDGGLVPNLINSAVDGIKELAGKTLVLELVSDELDPKTNIEKKTPKSSVQNIGKKEDEIRYEAQFELSTDFGSVGAVTIENEQQEEVFLKSIVLHGFPDIGHVHFTCNSWIQPKHDGAMKRVFFTDKSYLPSQTPRGLQRLREEELVLLRGNGEGECQSSDRIYDYDVYNDIGDPDTNIDLKRPVLGGTKQNPYPRRCRTGRKHSDADPLSEKKSSGFYVPRDEAFASIKQTQFTSSAVSLGLNAIFESVDTILTDPNLGFFSFEDIDTLFKEGLHLPPLKANGLSLLQRVIPKLIKAANDTQNILRFDAPETFKRDKFFWFSDVEFARETLAGVNPYSIQLVKEWPLTSKLDPQIYGPQESTITREVIEPQIITYGTIEEALKEKKLFMLDYHDLFLPYVSKVRKIKGTTLYGSRTLFFLTDQGILKPLAIELTRPPMDGNPQWKQVFQPSCDSTNLWLWRLAKAHVLAHDSGYHELISHWGMAVADPNAPHGLKLTIEDYPFANDGLLIWDAIKQWVTDYVNHYYPTPSIIESDQELQAWWKEIKTVGHGDKSEEPWWPNLNTSKDLIDIITTIAWVASGHHAAVNFSQYAYGGYFPNRPTIARNKMPTEDPSEEEWGNFLNKPEQTLLECFPSQIQATLVMVVLNLLSDHSLDEQYIGKYMEPSWAENPTIKVAFERFNRRLKEIEGIIDSRNGNSNLKNRHGAGIMPYELLKPFSGPGVTGKGVPYSISI